MKIYKISKKDIWYHGSNKSFDTFSDYSWFTISKDMASNYISWSTQGKKADILYTVNINISNPLDLTMYDMDEKMNIEDGDIEYFMTDIGVRLEESEVEKQLSKRFDVDQVSTSWILNTSIKFIHGYDGIKILESGVLTCCVFDGNNVSILNKTKINN